MKRGYANARRRIAVAIALGGLLGGACLIGGAAFAVYRTVWAEGAAIEKTRDFVLHHADHARIVEEARQMLNNPSLYFEPRDPSSGRYRPPKAIPPYIGRLDPTRIKIDDGGQEIEMVFGRRFWLYVARKGAPAPFGGPPAREIHPGLWYVEHEGN